MHCPQSFAQIDRDMSLYATVDPDRIAQEIPQRFGQRQSLCHYTIKDNKVLYTRDIWKIQEISKKTNNTLEG